MIAECQVHNFLIFLEKDSLNVHFMDYPLLLSLLFSVYLLAPLSNSEEVEYIKCFPDSSVGKESACNVGDSNSILGSGRSAGEGTGHPLQHSRTLLVAQLVKNPPAMQETRVQFLGW